ncbi:unnamed protein product [Prorocentrum cordatum]|uniref:Uncharacterized protein n=1 Tax=Prorocentrum cordatum TaxID=2364126 RepID=A0ABN9QK62_9DINO|nr:unnamed protein product [Polarella glacialis]
MFFVGGEALAFEERGVGHGLLDELAALALGILHAHGHGSMRTASITSSIGRAPRGIGRAAKRPEPGPRARPRGPAARGNDTRAGGCQLQAGPAPLQGESGRKIQALPEPRTSDLPASRWPAPALGRLRAQSPGRLQVGRPFAPRARVGNAAEATNRRRATEGDEEEEEGPPPPPPPPPSWAPTAGHACEGGCPSRVPEAGAGRRSPAGARARAGREAEGGGNRGAEKKGQARMRQEPKLLRKYCVRRPSPSPSRRPQRAARKVSRCREKTPAHLEAAPFITPLSAVPETHDPTSGRREHEGTLRPSPSLASCTEATRNAWRSVAVGVRSGARPQLECGGCGGEGEARRERGEAAAERVRGKLGTRESAARPARSLTRRRKTPPWSACCDVGASSKNRDGNFCRRVRPPRGPYSPPQGPSKRGSGVKEQSAGRGRDPGAPTSRTNWVARGEGKARSRRASLDGPAGQTTLWPKPGSRRAGAPPCRSERRRGPAVARAGWGQDAPRTARRAAAGTEDGHCRGRPAARVCRRRGSLQPGRGQNLQPGRSQNLQPGRGESPQPGRTCRDAPRPGRGGSLRLRQDVLRPGRG